MKIEDMTLRDYFAAKASEEDIKAQAEVIRSSSTLGILPDGWLAVARYMHADAMLAAREAGYALDDGCEPVEVEAALASRDAEIERLRHALELAVPVMDAHAGPSRLAEFVSAGRTAQEGGCSMTAPTRDEVIRLAKESNTYIGLFLSAHYVEFLQSFYAEAVAAEREACAKVCDKEAVRIVIDSPEERAYNNAVSDCAAAIRARGKK